MIASAPPQSAGETATIKELRHELAGSYVGGPSAQQIDLKDTNSRDRLVVIPIVLVSVLPVNGPRTNGATTRRRCHSLTGAQLIG